MVKIIVNTIYNVAVANCAYIFSVGSWFEHYLYVFGLFHRQPLLSYHLSCHLAEGGRCSRGKVGCPPIAGLMVWFPTPAVCVVQSCPWARPRICVKDFCLILWLKDDPLNAFSFSWLAVFERKIKYPFTKYCHNHHNFTLLDWSKDSEPHAHSWLTQKS